MMRCICCDSKDTQWWKDNWYCRPCLRAIKGIIREDKWVDREEGRAKKDGIESV